MRARPAPTAARIAISRFRPAARASSRLATLAQAMSNTKLTAATRMMSELAYAADQRVLQRLHGEPDLIVVGRSGVKRAVSRVGGLQLRFGGVESDARPDAADDLKVVAVVIGNGIELKGNVNIGRLIEFDFEIRADDANDFIRFAAQSDALADNMRIRAEMRLPERISQDCCFGRPWKVLFMSVGAALEHLGSAKTEEIGRGARGLNLFGSGIAGQISDVKRKGGDILEGFRLLTPVVVFIGRCAAARASAEGVLKHDDAFGIGEGEWS